MSKKYPGGIITKSPATPTGPFQTGSAPGVWTIDQATYWIKQDLWPIAGRTAGWVGILGASSSDIPNGIAVDSSNNIYVGGYSNNGGGNYGYATVKLDNSGAIQWQKKLTGTNNAFGMNVTVDSSGNVYNVGYSVLSFRSSMVLEKFDNSGSLLWQRSLSTSNNTDFYGLSVTTDSSGNVFVAGQGTWSGGSNNTAGYIVKYNASGTFQFISTVKVYTPYSIRDDSLNSVKIDSSGNIYAAGTRVYYNNPTTYRQIIVSKYNSSGTLLWMKEVAGNNDDYGFSLAINSSGDVYVACQNKVGVDQCLLLKYNNSGTLQWQRRLGDGTNNGGWRYVELDSVGNVYVSGYYTFSGSAKILIAKYNPSGVLQWQRRLGASSGNQYNYGLAIGSDDNIYVTGSLQTSTDEMLVAKLANNGAGTGTISVGGTSIVYAATTLTDSTPTYTDASSSLAGGNMSYSAGTPSFTSSDMTLTSTVTSL